MANRNRREDRVQSRSQSRRAQRVIQARQAKRKRLLTIIGGAVGAALLVVLLLVLFNRDNSGPAADEPVDEAPEIAAEIPRDGRTLGDPNAPVTVVEYGDFQWPGCGFFAREVEPQLVENYVSTGEVFFEYRHLAFLGDESRAAAEASMCAMDQGLFWEYHDTVFHNQVQGPYDDGAFSRERLDRIAEVVGLNMDEFGQCMDDDKYSDEVEEMTAEAGAQGITQTPSFLINGELVTGISNFSDLSTEIEARLAGGTPAPDATPDAEASPTQ